MANNYDDPENFEIIKKGNLFATQNPGLSGTKIDIIKSITQVMATICTDEWMETIRSKPKDVYAVVIRSSNWDPNLTKLFLASDAKKHNSKSFEEYNIVASIETVQDLKFEVTEEHLDRLHRFVRDPLTTNSLSIICCDLKCYPFRYYAFHVLLDD